MKSQCKPRYQSYVVARKDVLEKCFDLENEIRGLFKAFEYRLPTHIGQLRSDEEHRLEKRTFGMGAPNLARSVLFQPPYRYVSHLLDTGIR
ncbi:hypothetical protein HY11_17510 [Hyphomonas pacifica]|nr:hypothetical protein HY11_17510 [Hyphomonas pacifica]